MKMFKCEKPVIKINQSKFKKGKSFEVSFPVSYKYNGGIVIDGKHYDGYEVPNPDLPEGWELLSIGVGLQMTYPPYCTKVLTPKKQQKK